MEFLYTISVIVFYAGAIRLAALFNKKARLWVEGHKNWEKQLLSARKNGDRWFWFHCASLGEYEDCCEVFNRIKKDNPSGKVLLTFFSPSGFEALKDIHPYDMIMYLPLDKKSNVKRFLNILKPEAVFFSRAELWYNYVTAIKGRNIPLFLLSLRLNKDSSFFKWPVKTLYARCFKSFTHIYCQNTATQQLLNEVFEVKNTSVTGNTRIGRIYSIACSNKEVAYIRDFARGHFVIVAGSCLAHDEENILSVIPYFELHKIKWIIVPHEINSRHINKVVSKNPDAFIRYSEVDRLSASHNVLYIDFVGGLKYLYKYADLAIIGGGFNRIGIHNIIEPAVYGVKTTFGPNHRNYCEALDLLQSGGAVIHHNAKELLEIIKQHVLNPTGEEEKKRIVNYVKSNTGGNSEIIESVRKYVPGLA